MRFLSSSISTAARQKDRENSPRLCVREREWHDPTGQPEESQTLILSIKDLPVIQIRYRWRGRVWWHVGFPALVLDDPGM